MYVANGAPRAGLAKNPLPNKSRTILSNDPQVKYNHKNLFPGNNLFEHQFQVANNVKLLASGLLGGYFWCSVAQKSTPTFSGDEIRDLNLDNFIFLASGPADAARNLDFLLLKI